MLSKYAGPGLVLFFCVSQAFRDVYFANVFQGIDFFVILFLAFSLATVAFAAVTILCKPHELARMREEIPAFIWMNVLTAVAWTSYFFSLKYLQPSIVNTLHAGAGPLTVVALAAFGIHIARPSQTRRGEHLCYLGIAASMFLLWCVVLADRSGLRTEGTLIALAGLALPILSGTSITISSLWAKRMNERGISADGVTAARYILIVVISLMVAVFSERPWGIATTGELAGLAVATAVLIVFPLYAFQLGVERTTPLTTNAVRALGPVMIFGMEWIDGRVSYSGPALLGIALYSFFVIASNLVRGWQGDDDKPQPKVAVSAQACANSQ